MYEIERNSFFSLSESSFFGIIHTYALWAQLLRELGFLFQKKSASNRRRRLFNFSCHYCFPKMAREHNRPNAKRNKLINRTSFWSHRIISFTFCLRFAFWPVFGGQRAMTDMRHKWFKYTTIILSSGFILMKLKLINAKLSIRFQPLKNWQQLKNSPVAICMLLF